MTILTSNQLLWWRHVCPLPFEKDLRLTLYWDSATCHILRLQQLQSGRLARNLVRVRITSSRVIHSKLPLFPQISTCNMYLYTLIWTSLQCHGKKRGKSNGSHPCLFRHVTLWSQQRYEHTYCSTIRKRVYLLRTYISCSSIGFIACRSWWWRNRNDVQVSRHI